MKMQLTVILLTTTLALVSPVYAGGPVIPADPEVPTSTAQPKRNVLPLILFGAVVAAIIVNSGSDNCTEPTPEEPDDRC